MTEQYDAHVWTWRIWQGLTKRADFIFEFTRLYRLRDQMLTEIARNVTREVLGPDHPLRKLPKLREARP